MTKCVVFDVGNVLLHWDVRRLYRQLLPDEAAIDSFLEETHFFEWNLEFDNGRDFTKGVEEWGRIYPHHAELLRAFDSRWLETIAGPISGSVDVLNRLTGDGVPVYAITNFSAEKWAVAQKEFDFLSTSFRDVVVSGQEKLLKPDPKIYQTLLKRNDLKAGNCLFIDDSATNVAGAKAVGMDAVLFESPQILEQDLKGRGILAAG